MLTRQTVVVKGDRIAAVGPTGSVEVPADAHVIDGRGQFLLPGLGEMHGHNPAVGSSRDYVESIYLLFLANGVTTVRGMLGWPGQLELRDEVLKGTLTGPTLYLAGPSFNGAAVQTPEQAEARVREQHREGWDLLKVHPGLKLAVYDAMVRTAKPLGMRFAGHVPAEVGVLHALEAGQETIDHLDGYITYLGADAGPIPADKLAEAIRVTRDRDAWVVPTMVLWDTIEGAASLDAMLAYPELRYMPKSEVERWTKGYRARIDNPKFDAARARRIAANRQLLLKAFHEAQVKILFGTDAPQSFSVPGFSIHREMQAMVSAGMSPYEILKSATADVGSYFQHKDTFGQVARGYRADLLLLTANPFEDIAHLKKRSGVMVRGRWMPEAELQGRLKAIAEIAPQR